MITNHSPLNLLQFIHGYKTSVFNFLSAAADDIFVVVARYLVYKAMDVTLYAPQEVSYHADVIYLLP